MKKLRLVSAILALLILLSTFGLSVSANYDYRPQLAELIMNAEEAPAPGGNYNSDTVSALKDALDEARAVYVDKTATSEEIKEQIEKLDTALYNLETYNWYTTGLWMALQYVENLNPEDYSTVSFNTLREIYMKHSSLIYFPPTQEAIDMAVDEINEAVANLIPVGGATAPVETATDKLRRFVNRAEHIIYSSDKIYSDNSMKALSDAYKYGDTLLENDEADDGVLYAAAYSIETALEGLVTYTWDMTNLELAFKNAREVTRNAAYYTEESYNAFEDVYYIARSIKYTAQSQNAVDAAALSLTNAINELELLHNPPIPEETAESRYRQMLFDVRQHLHVYGEIYTEESSRALYNAVNEANKLEFDRFATDEEYNAATNLLEEALAAAEFIPVETQTVPMDTTAAEITTNAAENTSASVEATETTALVTEPTTSTFDEPAETTVATLPAESIATEPQEATTTATESDTTPTETSAQESSCILGDADLNSKVSIKDVTTIQKHAAKLLSLSDTGLMAADSNQDNIVNIKDATEIQKYIANLPSNKNIGKEFKIENTPADTTVIPWYTETTVSTFDEADTETTPATIKE